MVLIYQVVMPEKKYFQNPMTLFQMALASLVRQNLLIRNWSDPVCIYLSETISY